VEILLFVLIAVFVVHVSCIVVASTAACK
jgi:hypothetical protein